MTDPQLSPKQDRAVRESTGKVNLWDGAIRSGKTMSSLLRWLLYVARAPRGGELIVVARTRDSANRNVFLPLQDPGLFGDAAALVHYTPGAPTATILGRTVHVMGASDAKAERVLRGLTCAGAYVDEVTVIPEQFFTQLLGRLSVPGSKLFGTTNPDSPAHWLKRKYLDRIDELTHWRSWHFTMDDNPVLTPEYIAQRRAEFTGLWFRRFILGEWVAAEGAVYDTWDPARHVVRAADLPPMDRLLALGVDHGTTNPSAGILVGIADGALWAVDEWWSDGKAMQARPTVAWQSQALRAWLGDRRPEWVCVDPAAAALRAQLYEDSMPGLVPADNDVHYGIPVVASLLAEGRLLVADSCPNLIREFPAYAWDDKATLKGEDKPLKVADHALDALRYAVVTTEASWRPAMAAPLALAA